MPRTRSLAWSELKIGLLTIVALVIAAALIFTLTGTKGFFWQRYPLKTRFPNVAGLAKGSPVRVAGVEVGSVTQVDFSGAEVDVTFEVKKDVRPRITDKSIATLGSISLLGESSVDITPATTGVEEITSLVRDIHAGRGTVGKLITDDRLYAELQSFAASANGVTEAIK